MDEATRNQNAAADPAFSTWLSANAGSGKTRVLTDRVARMLLRDVPPQNILCLTYTKAAAGEMQNRLFKRLGEWAMLDDASLSDELAKLGEPGFLDLALARTLFAQAIETPGGLKIQTIHSFCAALLRQFPLEAGVSPQFRELDDLGAEALIADVLDKLAEDGTLSEVAELYSGDTLGDLAKSVASQRDRFDPPLTRSEVFDKFGVEPSQSDEALINKALAPGDLAFLKGLAPLVITSTKVTDRGFGIALGSLPDVPTLATLPKLESLFLYGADTKNPFSLKKNPPTGELRKGALATHVDRFDSIRQAVADTRAERVAFEAAKKTAILHDFAAEFLPAYASAKADRAVLDFDDLIDYARKLLSDQSLAWVLYRLDGGIDHILVDEAQDTSPAQWRVIEALAAEMTAGQGSQEDKHRSLFVVGDKKQSIYSFQGADAREFDATFDRFGARLAGGPGLQARELPHSFRSSAAILKAVDSTFVDDAADGLGANFRHIAFHEDRPGRVDLWPLIKQPEKPDDPEWYDPVDRRVANDPSVVLSEKIASEIQRMIKSETIPNKNGKFRPITAGDFLILVRGRSGAGDIFDQIIRACKKADLPMAGADRLKVSAELAVRDLLAVLSFLALPEDDLSLASALRSPLLGWSEAELYDLANTRLHKKRDEKPPYLWEELRRRRNDFPETVTYLDDLRDQVDFLRPYELLERILSNHGGRSALLSRLGPEAEDGIDELLNQALSFEQSEIPSLTAFLIRASAQSLDIKRQTDTSGGLIRVMTVHGAKGLEAPIVILPDTTRPERARTGEVIIGPDNTPLWSAARADSPQILEDALDATALSEREERQRLLYVAMTRAESWLIACGMEPAKPSKIPHWHDLIAEGLSRADAGEIDTPIGRITRLQHGDWNAALSADATEETPKMPDLPACLTESVPSPLAAPKPISPSDLGGEKTISGLLHGLDEAAAKDRGTLLHRLLEHLPNLSREIRASSASRLIGTNDLTEEALASIEAYPQIFAPETLAEVNIAAYLPDLDAAMRGTIDRLIISGNDVTAVDFKTNANVPSKPDETPVGILRQMGAYHAALNQIWPDHTITLQVLWTANASLMEIPYDIARAALASATTS